MTIGLLLGLVLALLLPQNPIYRAINLFFDGLIIAAVATALEGAATFALSALLVGALGWFIGWIIGTIRKPRE